MERKPDPAKRPARTRPPLVPDADGIVRLTGGNPQIPKGDGDAPVQAYIAAMPGWKQGLGRRLDELVTSTLPGIHKAVRWNSPFYGMPDQGWMFSFHVFTRFVRVTFLEGRLLDPMPPGGTPRSGDGRWLDIHETDTPDEAQLVSWLRQASRLPGWRP